MRLQILAGALALAGPSAAFSDSSPLILLSTSAFPGASTSNQIQTSSSAIADAKTILSACPSSRYLFVSQPGVHSAELASSASGNCAMPHLCQAVSDSRIQDKFIVSEVIGALTNVGLVDFVKTACDQKHQEITVEELTLPPLTSDRAGSLADSDEILSKSIDGLQSSNSYTILFVGTPGEQTYEPEFDDRVRMDLKRDLRSSPMRRANETERDNRPLFEKYQFFTPGIFMAIITAIVLFSILFVGLRALASLEVSYGAFEKDMGPAAQKKQQ
ncbi:BIG/ATPase V1 complex, subunit S1 [Dactylonectria macrodidyma]|uniref:Protein BIG1 n=1 Tax=Dactylonectria macrodidyma TaxID=307937 RepID=A0A9P9FNK7_9HYPO|nr:BIG/ATPase V1 complex, subunit S1 [Dactylonectria macrodidyma]